MKLDSDLYRLNRTSHTGLLSGRQSQRGYAAVALEVQFVDAGEVEVGQFYSGSEYSPVVNRYRASHAVLVILIYFYSLSKIFKLDLSYLPVHTYVIKTVFCSYGGEVLGPPSSKYFSLDGQTLEESW